MTLKSHIFLWVFLATVVPLTALALAATYYSERSYQREVQREVSTSLSNLGAEMDRRLQTQREMIMSLAHAPALRDFLPVLAAIERGVRVNDYATQRDRLNRFFEEMEVILPGRYTIRVLDTSGNSLVRVVDGKRTPAQYDSLDGIPYAEQEVNAPAFTRALSQLAPNEVSFIALPHHQLRDSPNQRRPMYDYIVPLTDSDGSVVGYLTVTILGEIIDRIIDHAPRLYKGQLFIAESNPDRAERNGYLLYDDAHELHLAQIRPRLERIQDYYSPRVWERLNNQAFGRVRLRDKEASIYYVEVLPYPNLLVSWIIGTRIDNSVISAPFQDIRLSIWLFAGMTLVISLILANMGARKIARPVCRLADNLKGYADGDRKQRLAPDSIRELGALADSFNYMADTLERARDERDRAQHMLLQSAKLASIGQMAAGIGHELNNPLNNILSLSKLIDRTLPADSAPSVHGDLQSLREEALRASEIVKGILNFARQVPPHYAPFEVLPWLEQTIALVRQEAKNKGVELSWRCAGKPELEGDRGQLQQALINLLLNAIQASAPGAVVSVLAEVEAGTQGEQLCVTVRDEGTGVPAAALDNVFDPFYTTKPVGEGSGLGLSISLGIVEFHDGSLSIANNPEGGASAVLRVPLRRASDSSQGKPTPASASEPAAQTSPGSSATSPKEQESRHG